MYPLEEEVELGDWAYLLDRCKDYASAKFVGKNSIYQIWNYETNTNSKVDERVSQIKLRHPCLPDI